MAPFSRRRSRLISVQGVSCWQTPKIMHHIHGNIKTCVTIGSIRLFTSFYYRAQWTTHTRNCFRLRLVCFKNATWVWAIPVSYCTYKKNFNVLHIYLLLIRGRNIIKLCQMNIVNISISLLQKTQKLKIFEILFVHFRPSREVIFESKIGKSVTRLQSDQIWRISKLKQNLKVLCQPVWPDLAIY